MTKNCVICGKEFQSSNQRRKTCLAADCSKLNHERLRHQWWQSPKGKAFTKQRSSKPEEKERKRQWNQSGKGREYLREYHRKWRKSIKRKEWNRKYQQSTKNKEYKRKWWQSQKGKSLTLRNNLKRRPPTRASINFLLTLNLSQTLNQNENTKSPNSQ